jgi:small subunit ribosomal protein S3
MKKSIQAAMKMGAEGIKIMCGGRLAGAEIARSEKYMEGRVPLHTLRADIDFATATAHTTYGTIGVKCWICRGEVLDRGMEENYLPQRFREEPRHRTERRDGGERAPRGRSHSPRGDRGPRRDARPSEATPAIVKEAKS